METKAKKLKFSLGQISDLLRLTKESYCNVKLKCPDTGQHTVQILAAGIWNRMSIFCSDHSLFANSVSSQNSVRCFRNHAAHPWPKFSGGTPPRMLRLSPWPKLSTVRASWKIQCTGAKRGVSAFTMRFFKEEKDYPCCTIPAASLVADVFAG